MKVKIFMKKFLGLVRCKINNISIVSGSVYIGKSVKIVGGNKIVLHSGVTIRPGVELWCSGNHLEIGENSEIGVRNRISIANALSIGKNVLISPNVYITDCDHRYEDINLPIMNQGIIEKDNEVFIKDNAYIGINSVIVGNVTIGKGSVIGANSVVTKDIPDYCVAVGSPAVLIKKYNFNTNKWERCKENAYENINACQLEN